MQRHLLDQKTWSFDFDSQKQRHILRYSHFLKLIISFKEGNKLTVLSSLQLFLSGRGHHRCHIYKVTLYDRFYCMYITLFWHVTNLKGWTLNRNIYNSFPFYSNHRYRRTEMKPCTKMILELTHKLGRKQ